MPELTLTQWLGICALVGIVSAIFGAILGATLHSDTPVTPRKPKQIASLIPGQSTYVFSEPGDQFCGYCESPVSVLADPHNGERPRFQICMECGNAVENGVGSVQIPSDFDDPEQLSLPERVSYWLAHAQTSA